MRKESIALPQAAYTGRHRQQLFTVQKDPPVRIRYGNGCRVIAGVNAAEKSVFHLRSVARGSFATAFRTPLTKP